MRPDVHVAGVDGLLDQGGKGLLGGRGGVEGRVFGVGWWGNVGAVVEEGLDDVVAL